MPEPQAGVGVSEKWDAREAGREVAENTLEKLDKDPDFFLLFSTIHYKDSGGFQEFLDGVWEVLPKRTPLIGGTVAGFITPQDCFVHGAAGMAVSYPNMDVAVGVGRNTKRNPKHAARECAEMIKKGLGRSKYKNKFLIDLVSAPIIPKLPLIGGINVTKSKVLGDILSYIFVRVFSYLGHGVGKEEDVIKQLGLLMPEYCIIGGSTIDDINYLANYQFIENRVCTNSIVAIGCTVDLPIFLQGIIGLHQTNKIFRITGTTFDDRIITRIGNKSAKEYLLKLLDISEDQFGELEPFYYKTSDYFPITFEENREYTSGIGGIFGDNIVLGYKAQGRYVRLLSVTGKEIINTIDTIFQNSNKFFPFMLIFSSGIRLNILGKEVFTIKGKLDNYLNGIPYLVAYTINENIGTQNNPKVARVYSFNVMSLKQRS